MRRVVPLAVILALSACNYEPEAGPSDKFESALDEQAVAAGILPDPNNLSLAGQFETRSELGIDKFCATESGSDFDIGVLAVFGPESKCEAQGRASLKEDSVHINFSGEEACNFIAEYDGVEIRFPGAIPESCSSYCSPRASFSGTSYFMIEQGNKAAGRTLGRDIDNLCG